MPSFSRNSSRGNCARKLPALGAAITLTVLRGNALADGAHRFVFTAYRDAAGGADVVAGRYQAALVQLERYRDVTALRMHSQMAQAVASAPKS